MKLLKLLFIIISIFLISLSCVNTADVNYEKEISEWQQSRLERLKGKNGWLNLAGLFWLKEGENNFGSDSANTIVFPANAPAFMGSIVKTGDSINITCNVDVEIRIDGLLTKKANLISDDAGKPSLMESGNLAWFIIKRDGCYGIRLRDYEHPRIAKLEHIPAYPITENWRIEADFIPYDSIRKIEIATVTGGSEISNCEGELVFKKGFQKYTLLPFTEGENFFIIFADNTNGIETYGNGRFLYTSKPDENNKVIIDFNKAYNPPCAFSPFATCPMPPKENILDLKVSAGEKEVHLE